MVKHTETIRRQQPANCLSVFDRFVGLALKGLTFKIEKHLHNFAKFFQSYFSINVQYFPPFINT